MSALGRWGICSAPPTRVMRARPASRLLMAWCTAAEPVAQAFSTRVAGLKRKASLACRPIGGGKSCGVKPAVKCPSQDLVHVRGPDPGVGQRLVRDPDDQALHGLGGELAKGGMSPANNASRHGGVLSRCRPLNVASQCGPGKAALSRCR